MDSGNCVYPEMGHTKGTGIRLYVNLFSQASEAHEAMEIYLLLLVFTLKSEAMKIRRKVVNWCLLTSHVVVEGVCQILSISNLEFQSNSGK